MGTQTEQLITINKEQRLGLTFHRTFSLVRPAITEILQLAKEVGSNQAIDKKKIREKTNLGTIYVEAMPRYAFGSGLLTQKYELTTLGSIVCNNDPLLENLATQWIMHFHLSAPFGPGPIFWHDLVVHHFLPGEELTHEQISSHIYESVMLERDKPLRKEDADSTATIFLGTYIKSDGLDLLGIIKETSPKIYRVLEPAPPPMWVVAYALLDLWQARFSNLTTINLNDLYGEQGLTSLFMISKGRLNSMLEEMQREGLLELYRIAPPYQVVLLHREVEPILERLYGLKDTA